MTVLTLAELNASIIAERNRIGATVDSYQREERRGVYRVRWGIRHRTDANDDVIFQDTHDLSYRPDIFLLVDHLRVVRLDRMPGWIISRFGEIKTALEAWIAGNGPWPEPKEETVESDGHAH
jgi:hypothetical protein